MDFEQAIIVSRQAPFQGKEGDAAIPELAQIESFGHNPLGRCIWQVLQTHGAARSGVEPVLEAPDVEREQLKPDRVAPLEALADGNLVTLGPTGP